MKRIKNEKGVWEWSFKEDEKVAKVEKKVEEKDIDKAIKEIEKPKKKKSKKKE